MNKPKKEGLFAKLFSFALAYKWLLIFFIPFFIIQIFTISFLPWDSVPYFFQGKWFCGEQVYLEMIRPPVPGVFNCIFGAQFFSIIISTALASVLYFAGILLLYKKDVSSFDQFTLALFAFLFPPILFLSNFGSDLFALAFLLIAIAVSSPAKKGFLFALSSLSRYNFLVFGVVILWQMRKTPKKIPFFIAVVFLTWVPWLIFNYLYSGDPLFSLNETIYLNIFMKGAGQPMNLEQYAIILLFLATFFALGLRKFWDNSLNHSALINAGQFVLSAVKENRFINLITPALAFNASRLSKEKILFKGFFVLLFFLSFAMLLKPLFEDPVGYYNFVFHKDVVPEDSFMFQCKVASDKWVLFYPHGIVAQYLPDPGRYGEYLDNGAVLVVYNYKDVNLDNYSNVINRGEYIIIKPDSCAPQTKRYISGAWNYKVFEWVRDHNYWVSDLRDWPE